jgi:hypothetical protein
VQNDANGETGLGKVWTLWKSKKAAEKDYESQ